MTNKKLLLFVLCIVNVSVYAMEEKECAPKGQEFCIDTLLRSFDDLEVKPEKKPTVKKLERLKDICWDFLGKQNKTELGKLIEVGGKKISPCIMLELTKKIICRRKRSHIPYLISRMPSAIYPSIGFELINSYQSLEGIREILEPICSFSSVDYDTNKVLKMFMRYCRRPYQFDYTAKTMCSGDKPQCDMQALNLSWHALLDIKSDAPYQFLLECKKLIIPGKIINYLLKMDIKYRKIESIEEAKRILRRVHFVLENGASVDTNLKTDGITSFRYVSQVVGHLARCSDNNFPGRPYLYAFEVLDESELELHVCFFKGVLTLFVEHLRKRGDRILDSENNENLSNDQIVDYLIYYPNARNRIIFTNY